MRGWQRIYLTQQKTFKNATNTRLEKKVSSSTYLDGATASGGDTKPFLDRVRAEVGREAEAVRDERLDVDSTGEPAPWIGNARGGRGKAERADTLTSKKYWRHSRLSSSLSLC